MTQQRFRFNTCVFNSVPDSPKSLTSQSRAGGSESREARVVVQTQSFRTSTHTTGPTIEEVGHQSASKLAPLSASVQSVSFAQPVGGNQCASGLATRKVSTQMRATEIPDPMAALEERLEQVAEQQRNRTNTRTKKARKCTAAALESEKKDEDKEEDAEDEEPGAKEDAGAEEAGSKEAAALESLPVRKKPAAKPSPETPATKPAAKPPGKTPPRAKVCNAAYTKARDKALKEGKDSATAKLIAQAAYKKRGQEFEKNGC